MVTGRQVKTEELAPPARVELLELLFADMGIADFTPEAQQAVSHYFAEYISHLIEKSGSNECWLTMDDIGIMAWVFLDAYDAGRTGNTTPKPS